MPFYKQKQIKIALAQTNFTTGDIHGNSTKIQQIWQQAATAQADLLIFPEMAITGYPVEDLALHNAFQNAATQAVEQLANYSTNYKTEAIIGGIYHNNSSKPHNSVFWIAGGQIKHIQHKFALPNYGVFDEQRIFQPATNLPNIIEWRGMKIGLLICEDMWHGAAAEQLAQQGANLFISINGSPYEIDKAKQRIEIASKITQKYNIGLIYTNLVGGQDELVFDGGSFIMNHDSRLQVMLPYCKEDLKITDWQILPEKPIITCTTHHIINNPSREESIYQAVTLGLRDYTQKSGFSGALIALSGGIDSALAATIAVDALGANNVRAVFMPSPYTSTESTEDAHKIAELLGIKLDIVPITKAMHSLQASICEILNNNATSHKATEDTTEENIQARIRSNLLMAISNKFGLMVVATSNKSEISVGYTTLYGDMCGGYSVLKDIYKTTVFKLCHWRNQNKIDGLLGPEGVVIPKRVITKPPSAELKPNQQDSDSLPPYEILDSILYELVENKASITQIAKQGFTEQLVKDVAAMLRQAEYKRRQSPPGARISSMFFGKDRRYPIVNKFLL